jgi:hypothetical protein
LETKRQQARRLLSGWTGEDRKVGTNRRAGCPPRGGIRRACGETPGRNRRTEVRDEPVGPRQGMVEPALWGRRQLGSTLSHQGVCGRHGVKEPCVTRGDLVASRLWQAGKPTYKLRYVKWKAMRGEESDSRIVLIKPWETMSHRLSAAALSGLGKSAGNREGHQTREPMSRRER